MSQLVNCPSGYTVLSTDYSGNLAQDIYRRYLVESNELPVIYNGLQVSAASGLSVTISAGSARGQDITITDTPNVTNLPSVVTLATPTTITVPASSTGYVILQINAIESGTGNQTWDVEISSTSGSNDLLPVFVTSLPTPGVNSYPFAYVILAQVVTGVGSITSISAKPYLNTRSFDYNFLYNPIIGSGNGLNYIIFPNGYIRMSGIIGCSVGGGTSTTYPIPLSSFWSAVAINLSGISDYPVTAIGSTTQVTLYCKDGNVHQGNCQIDGIAAI